MYEFMSSVIFGFEADKKFEKALFNYFRAQSQPISSSKQIHSAKQTNFSYFNYFTGQIG